MTEKEQGVDTSRFSPRSARSKVDSGSPEVAQWVKALGTKFAFMLCGACTRVPLHSSGL